VQIAFNMDVNKWCEICNFHTGNFLSGISDTLQQITLWWLWTMAADEHLSGCSSGYHRMHKQNMSFNNQNKHCTTSTPVVSIFRWHTSWRFADRPCTRTPISLSLIFAM